MRLLAKVDPFIPSSAFKLNNDTFATGLISYPIVLALVKKTSWISYLHSSAFICIPFRKVAPTSAVNFF